MSATGPVIPKELEELRYPAVDNFRSVFAASFLAIGIYLLAIFLFSPDPVLPHHDSKYGADHGKAETHHDAKASADAHQGDEKKADAEHESKPDTPHEQSEKSH